MSRRDWASAIIFYRRVISLQPIPEIQLQFAHALKESGALDAAEQAYAAVPGNATVSLDSSFHRAVLLARLGRQKLALELLVDVLRVDPAHRGAFAALIELDGRHLLPENFHGSAQAHHFVSVSSKIKDLTEELTRMEAASVYPPNSYDFFRRSHVIQNPPFDEAASEERNLNIVIDARRIGDAFLRSTLMSLLDQSVASWNALVISDEDIFDHTVSSIAYCDSRIVFSAAESADLPSTHFIHISAGTILERQSIAWFIFSRNRWKCPVTICDFDFGSEDCDGNIRYVAPQLWGAFDSDVLSQVANPPAVVLVDPKLVRCPMLADYYGAEWRRKVALSAKWGGHIPRLLGTVLGIPENALGGDNDDGIARWSQEPNGSPPQLGPVWGRRDTFIADRGARPRISITHTKEKCRISVIIQTRDAYQMLKVAIDTMKASAAHADLVEFIIVDNRSADAATLEFLNKLERNSEAAVIHHDEPFNWARANNVAAQMSSGDILLFANNDMEMITRGWDDLLRGYLTNEAVGVVGARLLYPVKSIQHAGMVFGVGGRGPIHAGVKLDESESGPQDRYDITCTVAAVTGAFMGTYRSIFSDVGGFDELRFAIAYNDVDFCMRVRAGGRKVLYAPSIELIHHESQTRGLNVTRSRVAWDLGEYKSLRERWGEAVALDPSYNIQWSKDRAFDGFREPLMREILASMDLTCRAEPWRLVVKS